MKETKKYVKLSESRYIKVHGNVCSTFDGILYCVQPEDKDFHEYDYH